MSRKVDLVRMAPDDEEPSTSGQVGRGAAQVFPTEHKKLKQVDEATIASVLGAKQGRFLSEAQLEDNKQQHGERLEDGTFAGRTLREALAANKAEREEKFQDTWKQMKTGKNRPLDDGEVEFLESLEEEERQKQQSIRDEEQRAMAQLEAAQKAAAEQAAAGHDAQGAARGAAQAPARPAPTAKRRPKVKAVSAAPARAQQSAADAGDQIADAVDASKSAQGVGTHGNMQGLLGGYASDSESGSGA